MNVSAKSVKDWGEALKLPLIFGGILFIAWRLFRKKEDYSYNKVDVATMPQTGWGVVSFSDDSIKADAQELYDAMEDWGTTEDNIEAIRLKYVGNRLALSKLWNAFDMKKYGSYGSPLGGFGGTPKNLKQWLQAELSANEFSKWKDMFALIGK